jgi:hypothetical protein
MHLPDVLYLSHTSRLRTVDMLSKIFNCHRSHVCARSLHEPCGVAYVEHRVTLRRADYRQTAARTAGTPHRTWAWRVMHKKTAVGDGEITLPISDQVALGRHIGVNRRIPQFIKSGNFAVIDMLDDRSSSQAEFRFRVINLQKGMNSEEATDLIERNDGRGAAVRVRIVCKIQTPLD